MKYLLPLLILMLFACEKKPVTTITPWERYDQSAEIATNADHPSRRLQYKLIQSRLRDKNDIWGNVADQIKYFSEEDYQKLMPLIYEQDILTIQGHIKSGDLSYEQLTQWYLYRIVKYENDRDKTLNAIISINPNAVAEARLKDKQHEDGDHPIYGMPILLKDNINYAGLPTTAGAVALADNQADDAYITERLKASGAIILGKANLSEWANFLCLGCPNGYSAVGGQTLNAYGRKKIDTGGSSAGSGVAMAANYATAAVGTETSGSILSPSSKSSLVGLKPTVGLLSRAGIVPISSTLDTPGPMTRSVSDNAILLSAMTGEDPQDPATQNNPKNIDYIDGLKSATLSGKRFGVVPRFLEDSIYKLTVAKVGDLGAELIEIEEVEVNFDNFGDLLSIDMKTDLPAYIRDHAADNITYTSVPDILDFNLQDTTVRIPYGQGRIARIMDIEMTDEEFDAVKKRLHSEGIKYFETPMQAHNLDAILSINNYSAGYAAAARYPCLTIPMGYGEEGDPVGLTFIARPFEEDKLLKMGYAFEQATKKRVPPAGY